MPTPLIPGQEIGGTVVLAMVDPEHYRVRHLCCGQEETLARSTLSKRQVQKIDKCRRCKAIGRAASTAQDFAYLELLAGDVVGGLRIDAVHRQGPRAESCIYSVTYLCCRKIDTRTHEQVLMRRVRGAVSCRFCAREVSGLTRSSRAKPLPPPPPPPPPPRRLITLAEINRHISRIFK